MGLDGDWSLEHSQFVLRGLIGDRAGPFHWLAWGFYREGQAIDRPERLVHSHRAEILVKPSTLDVPPRHRRRPLFVGRNSSC